jgi:hypothetical protein
MYFSKFKEDSVQFSSQKKLDPKLSSGQFIHASRRLSVSTLQACIRPDVLATCPGAFQSSRRIQHSSVSIWTTWQYHRDASQCSTSKRISFADTDIGRQLQSSGR